jgi:hypothetical protein
MAPGHVPHLRVTARPTADWATGAVPTPGAYSGLLGGRFDCQACRLGERERIDRAEVEVCVRDVCE